jgi:hypothetical protein
MLPNKRMRLTGLGGCTWSYELIVIADAEALSILVGR